MSEVWKTPIGFTHTSTISAATATVKPLSYEIVRNCVDVPSGRFKGRRLGGSCGKEPAGGVARMVYAIQRDHDR